MPRFHVPDPLQAGTALALPAEVARHVQVLRGQPGQVISVFNARDGEWSATITRMQRQTVDVTVTVQTRPAQAPPSPRIVAVGMPANERMDFLVEKATELGATAIAPLLCERSVLRLHGERAQRKVAHWQAVAVAASEQCGRLDPPVIEPVTRCLDALAAWARQAPAPARWVLSLASDAHPFGQACTHTGSLFLSGPEGGLTPDEEDAARRAGFVPVSLGPRVLRADTAPLAALAALELLAPT